MLQLYGYSETKGFNGAAPVRARRCACVEPQALPLHALQRGRACEGAEIEGKLAWIQQNLELQRGRACEGAEMP